MNKFKPGDKVVAYIIDADIPGRIVGYVSELCEMPLRTFEGQSREHLQYLKIDTGIGTINAHPKQCRRLVKKEDSFKIGDRVRVYGGLAYVDAVGILEGQLGTILEIQNSDREEFPNALNVCFDKSLDGTLRFYVHPKQCRKI